VYSDQNNRIETVRIYNSTGALMKTIKINNNNIDISELASGLYLVEIQTNLNERFIKYLVRE
jgi:hypothetical protein